MKYIAKVFVYDDADKKNLKIEATGEFATLKEAKYFTDHFRDDCEYRSHNIKVVDLED